jgi:hypothetical protein
MVRASAFSRSAAICGYPGRFGLCIWADPWIRVTCNPCNGGYLQSLLERPILCRNERFARRQGVCRVAAHSPASSGFDIIPRPIRSCSRRCAYTRVLSTPHCVLYFLGICTELHSILCPSIDIYGRKWYKLVEIPMCMTGLLTSYCKSICGGDRRSAVFRSTP